MTEFDFKIVAELRDLATDRVNLMNENRLLKKELQSSISLIDFKEFFEVYEGADGYSVYIKNDKKDEILSLLAKKVIPAVEVINEDDLPI